MKVKLITPALLCLALSPITVMAGISIDRTRVILTEKSRSVSVNLSNTNMTVPFLAQAWIEDEKGNKITSPLIVSPPLQRVEGGQKGVVKVMRTTGVEQLPNDRESLFYFNIREIPPKPEKENTLQLAMQSRIKLFYRPTSVIPKTKSEIWQDQLVFNKQGSNKLIIKNPTPYYITITSLTDPSVNNGKGVLTNFSGVMVSPLSEKEINVKHNNFKKFTLVYVNDYGGHPKINFTCQSNRCSADDK